jgi:hypothetical protein
VSEIVDLKVICDDLVCGPDGGTVTLRPCKLGEKRACAQFLLAITPAHLGFFAPGRIYTVTVERDTE